jgi:hypothetical protein
MPLSGTLHLIEIAVVRSTFSPIEDRQVDLAEATIDGQIWAAISGTRQVHPRA